MMNRVDEVVAAVVVTDLEDRRVMFHNSIRLTLSNKAVKQVYIHKK
jgi:hypothetical protein